MAKISFYMDGIVKEMLFAQNEVLDEIAYVRMEVDYNGVYGSPAKGNVTFAVKKDQYCFDAVKRSCDEGLKLSGTFVADISSMKKNKGEITIVMAWGSCQMPEKAELTSATTETTEESA
jgi:hypothetical protein